MSEPKELQVDAQNFSILYVEDNDTLREHAFTLLKKFFGTVYIACVE